MRFWRALTECWRETPRTQRNPSRSFLAKILQFQWGSRCLRKYPLWPPSGPWIRVELSVPGLLLRQLIPCGWSSSEWSA
ncbi:hypothetical protein M5689_013017 [Euphorbia peplus]|nr:hypothetical protein M5689_013017 [Euphorbia peplus]